MIRHDHHKTLSRRAFIGGGLAVAAFARPAGAQRGGPPPFGTVRHQFTLIRGARPVPSVPIARLDGKSFDLTSFQRKVVLLNFWATWCPACRTELPMLDRLQQIMGRTHVQVVAIALDRDGRAVVAPFLRNMPLRHLELGLDPGGLIARAGEADNDATPFALYGMPISYLIGPSGRVEGYIAGEADWLSDDARRLLDYYVGPHAG